jgi:putative transposase
MARLARIVLPGVAHHVTQRGNDRQDIFFSNADRALYLQYLRESAAREGLALSAYCLMTNHIHLVVTPEREDSLARALGRTHLMYAQHILRAHRRSGHLWQSRFYSCPLDEAHEHNATAYVELNPVRARMVKAPWDYPWSSAAAHCGHGTDASGVLDLQTWFETIPAQSWKATLNEIGESDAIVERIRNHTRTGRPLGSETFLSRIEKTLDHRVRALSVGRPKGRKDRRKRKPRKSKRK